MTDEGAVATVFEVCSGDGTMVLSAEDDVVIDAELAMIAMLSCCEDGGVVECDAAIVAGSRSS
jgi:hypothetical protein